MKKVKTICSATNVEPRSERTIQVYQDWWESHLILFVRLVAKVIVWKFLTCRKLRKPTHSTLMTNFISGKNDAISPTFFNHGCGFIWSFSLEVWAQWINKVIFTCTTMRAIFLRDCWRSVYICLPSWNTKICLPSWLANDQYFRKWIVFNWSTGSISKREVEASWVILHLSTVWSGNPSHHSVLIKGCVEISLHRQSKL